MKYLTKMDGVSLEVVREDEDVIYVNKNKMVEEI